MISLQDMRSTPVAVSLAVLLALALPCFGQAGKAELFGTIHDPAGLGIPRARVTGEEQATGARFEVMSDERGEYHLLGLLSGRYAVAVGKEGFRPS